MLRFSIHNDLGDALEHADVTRLHALVHRRVDEVATVLLSVLVQDELHELLVHVHAAESVVTARRLHDELAVHDLENGHIEGASAEVIHQNRLLLHVVVQSVADRRSRWLVERVDLIAREARRHHGLNGSRLLVVVEVRGRRDGHFGNALAGILLPHRVDDRSNDLAGDVCGGHISLYVVEMEFGDAVVIHDGDAAVLGEVLNLFFAVGSSDDTLRIGDNPKLLLSVVSLGNLAANDRSVFLVLDVGREDGQVTEFDDFVAASVVHKADRICSSQINTHNDGTGLVLIGHRTIVFWEGRSGEFHRLKERAALQFRDSDNRVGFSLAVSGKTNMERTNTRQGLFLLPALVVRTTDKERERKAPRFMDLVSVDGGFK